jgi:hypothetical protein
MHKKEKEKRKGNVIYKLQYKYFTNIMLLDFFYFLFLTMVDSMATRICHVSFVRYLYVRMVE